MEYPKTRKADQIDDYHGTKVADPYRWLEDDNSEETKAWVVGQNKLTQGYLSKIPYRETLREKILKITNFPKYNGPGEAPIKHGNLYFFKMNTGLEDSSKVYVQERLDGKPRMLIDPADFSDGGKFTAVNISDISKDAKHALFSVSRSGSDWLEHRVIEIQTGKVLPDLIKWSKFSPASLWSDGFFYTKYEEPRQGQEFTAQAINPKLCFHKLGTPQAEDQVLFEKGSLGNDRDIRYLFSFITENKDYLVLCAVREGDEYYCKPLGDPKSKIIKLFEHGPEFTSSCVGTIGDCFVFNTTIDAPNSKVVLIDPKKSAKEHWKTLIPESKLTIEWAAQCGGKLFVGYLDDAKTKVLQYSENGQLEGEVSLPAIGTSWFFGGFREDDVAFYLFNSFTFAPNIFVFDIKTGKSRPFKQIGAGPSSSELETKQVFYASKDGTRVPMFIVSKKCTKLDGSSPTILTGYGGFNISRTPGFSELALALVEMGGTFAMACLRGGGEYGERWHQAGWREKKQNVFDDFIAAAEHLIKEGHTSKDKLAILGGSNGGLLVGACMAQRPDLFKVALPMIGVLDMLRYHKFTSGIGWSPEYGTSDNPDEFKYLYAYSPLHNLKTGVCYPATLVMTGDHDDRVVPAHSFKFAARLQECQGCDNPALIRIEMDAGHGSKTVMKGVDEKADLLVFTLWNMGIINL